MKPLSFLLPLFLLAAGAPPLAALAEEAPATPGEMSCPQLSPGTTAFMEKVVSDMMDPDSGFSHLNILGTPEIKEVQEADKARLRSDWAYLCRYRDDNRELAEGPAPRVVFMGDSITEFWIAGDPALFTDGVVDRGISGQTSAQMVARFWTDVVALHPQAVHIMTGTNDLAENTGYVTDEMYKNNIRAMVTLAKSNGIAVILASIPPAGKFGWRPDVDPPARIAVLNQWLKEYAAETGSVYVDYHTLLSDDGKQMNPAFSHDGVHPNRPGYEAIHAAAEQAIAEALPQ